MTVKPEIKEFVQVDFPRWLNSRVKYAPSIPLGILAALQPSKNGIERDYDNNPLCCAFNGAVALGKDTHTDAFKAFILVYYSKAATWYFRSIGDDVINVKTMAERLGISLQSVYDMAHKFANDSYRQAVINCNLNNKVQSMVNNPEHKF